MNAAAVSRGREGRASHRTGVSGLAAGLLDELHLLVHPIAVRGGMRLFDEGEPIPLTLVSSQVFKTGVLNLVYAPDVSPENAGYEEARAHLPRPGR